MVDMKHKTDHSVADNTNGTDPPRSCMQKILADIGYYRRLSTDPRTPRISRWLLIAAIAYAVMPFDLIPDFIPVLGQLDDLIIVPLLLWLSLMLIPAELKREIQLQPTASQGK